MALKYVSLQICKFQSGQLVMMSHSWMQKPRAMLDYFSVCMVQLEALITMIQAQFIESQRGMDEYFKKISVSSLLARDPKFQFQSSSIISIISSNRSQLDALEIPKKPHLHKHFWRVSCRTFSSNFSSYNTTPDNKV